MPQPGKSIQGTNFDATCKAQKYSNSKTTSAILLYNAQNILRKLQGCCLFLLPCLFRGVSGTCRKCANGLDCHECTNCSVCRECTNGSIHHLFVNSWQSLFVNSWQSLFVNSCNLNFNSCIRGHYIYNTILFEFNLSSPKLTIMASLLPDTFK